MALLDTGAISPMLKELFNFADVDAQQITDKIAEYLADLVESSELIFLTVAKV